jgi:hypothetical protein
VAGPVARRVGHRVSDTVTHLAGPDIEYNHEDGVVVRQRCSWCGAVLVDVKSWLVSVPVGQDSTIATWEVGRFVDVVSPDGLGGVWSLNPWEHEHEKPIPETACLRMPLEVTG